MTTPDADPRIQAIPPPPAPHAAVSVAPAARRAVMPSVLFGLVVGLVIGPLTGGLCCWLAGFIAFLWQWILVGAAVGPVGGAGIAFAEKKLRGEFVKPDIATHICALFGLIPAALIFLGGADHVMGRFSGHILLGAVCAGPMLGLLIGAILDRAFDSARQKSWGVAVACAAVALAVCGGIVYLVATLPTGPDSAEMARLTKSLILREWSKIPEMHGARIQTITLEPKGDDVYEGFVEAKIAGQVQRFSLTVVHEKGLIRWKLEPINR